MPILFSMQNLDASTNFASFITFNNFVYSLQVQNTKNLFYSNSRIVSSLEKIIQEDQKRAMEYFRANYTDIVEKDSKNILL